MPPKIRILLVGNDARYFLTHRLALARSLAQAGYELMVAVPLLEPELTQQLEQEPYRVEHLAIDRHGMSFSVEMKSLLGLYRLYRRYKPHLVHHFTIKPIIYGGLVARILRVPAVVHSLTGLGYFANAEGLLARLVRHLLNIFLRIALGNDRSRTIFQNEDDLLEFVDKKYLRPERAVLIRGSGVDLAEYAPLTPSEDPPLVVLASRMLWNKGVADFTCAAQHLIQAGYNARFVLVGAAETQNPNGIDTQTLEKWVRSGAVEWWGYRRDMREILSRSLIVCLPSTYGEGVPKALIEAAACERAIIATDARGCREIVRDGKNGLLTPANDTVALTAAIRSLLDDRPRAIRMGRRGRVLVECEFSLARVIEDTLKLYRTLIL